MTAIVLWNTVYLERATQGLVEAGKPVDGELLQYLSPTLQFLLGVWLFKEAFTADRLVGFALIWSALILFAGEGLLRRPPVPAKT